jgi:hypothetical protein
MPSQQLDNLVRIGQLKAEPVAQAEIDGLMRSGAARIKDAENAQLSLESRFDLAYNAAHAFSLAALRFHGYRSENRFLVFQSLQHTLGLAPAKWACSIRRTRSEISSSTKEVSRSMSGCSKHSSASLARSKPG